MGFVPMFVIFVHVLAWMNRFIDNCRLKRGKRRGDVVYYWNWRGWDNDYQTYTKRV